MFNLFNVIRVLNKTRTASSMNNELENYKIMFRIRIKVIYGTDGRQFVATTC